MQMQVDLCMHKYKHELKHIYIYIYNINTSNQNHLHNHNRIFHPIHLCLHLTFPKFLLPPGYPSTIQDLSITGDAQGQLLFTQFFRCVACLVFAETNQDQSQTTWSLCLRHTRKLTSGL